MNDATTIAYDPLASAVQVDPYPLYARLRQDSPVYYTETLDAYAVSRHADVRRVMHDHATFSSAAMAALVARPAEYAANEFDDIGADAPISIVGTDGDTHTRLRLIVNRGFTPRRMAALEADVRDLASSFVAGLVDDREADLMSRFAVPFPTVVIASLLGVDSDQRDDFRRWSELMVRGVFEPADDDQQHTIAQAGAEMEEWLSGAIETSNRDADNLISVLLRAELDGGALTRDELRVFVVTLLVAGSITTAYLIGNGVHELVGDPVLRARVTRDPSVIGRVVEESLRHDAPVQLMFRTATTDVEIAGTTIPSGATVLALIGSANRDDAAFTRAREFDIDRAATSEHLSFGHGVHFCLGAALARLEARIALEELLRGAPDLAFAGPSERITSVVFRGPTRLPLRFE